MLRWFPSVMLLGTAVTMTTGVGVNWSLLSLGSGMLVGLRINASMLLGAVLAWIVAPYALLRYGVIGAGFNSNDVLFWVMWPATGMMVAGGLTALVLRWTILVKTFRNLSTAKVDAEEFPLTWVDRRRGRHERGADRRPEGQPRTRRLDDGRRDPAVAAADARRPARARAKPTGDRSARMSNMMQGIFGVLAPGHIAANMLASGTTGTIAIDSEALMQDYKAGDMIGSSPKYLTIMQLHRDADRRRGGVVDVPAAARHLRHRRRQCRPELADLAQVGRLRRDSVAGA